MKPLKEEVRIELAKRFDLEPEELVFLAGGREDSDGVVFTVCKDGRKQVFKISQACDEPHVKSVLEFAHYLGTCGIRISSPIENKDGNIYEAVQDGDTLLIATLMDYIDGANPDGNELQENKALVYEWGKLTGKMHKAAKEYPVWKNSCENDGRYGFENEIDSFIKMSPNDDIRRKWEEIRERLKALLINRETYGFIHNDNHQMNIITAKQDIAVIDFDCAECHFFINDILLPVQGLLFDVTGGMMSPIYNMEVLKEFYSHFLRGYRTENQIDQFWLEQLGLFLEYRRLLLYTVMQGWMEHDQQANEAFLAMIEKPCDLKIEG